jgi:iron(III) transport system permease protein
MLDADFLTLMKNSFALAVTAAVLAVALALLFAYGKRLRQDNVTQGCVRFASLGYAIPGTVIAVGVMLTLSWFDHALDAWLSQWFGVSSGLLLSGTVFALLFAYSVRFLAVSLHSVDAGLTRINPSMDHAARSLGLSPSQVVRRIHLPLLRSSVFSALLLVFVDVLKELPATLVLRPFDFNTLAVRTYELASDERLADAAPSALAIVLVSLAPVILLSRSARAHHLQ